MKTKIVILAILMVAVASIQALHVRTITGKVTLKESGKVVAGVQVLIQGTKTFAMTKANGSYSVIVPDQNAVLIFSLTGHLPQLVQVGNSNVINVVLENDPSLDDELTFEAPRSKRELKAAGSVAINLNGAPLNRAYDKQEIPYNTEEYDVVNENIFHDAGKNPLSTFSIDVDAASYSNVRRFINAGEQPPRDAVRIEEMINYFHYDYPQPRNDDPFAIQTEMSVAPWNPKHRLVSIGLQGKTVPMDNLPASNLVFLIDVSGSMSDANKLPLLKASFKMLVKNLRAKDHVAIVVYAGAAGLVLPPTSGSEKSTIVAALDKLESGGSTAGGEGIELAYQVAKENFKTDGNNRIILATDGDFNVGESSNSSMEQLISEKRKGGIFLTVLGFGMGNYKDSKMEILADKGNGNYAYIDSFQEAQKVLVTEFGGTLFTIAKDVKLQVEFNPAKVQAYRLIGYENRLLHNEDFNNDKKDAGELGSGHTVTALYEIIPVGVESEFFKTDELKYQSVKIDPSASASREVMTVKFRYKKPDGEVSKLIVHPLMDESVVLSKTSDNFRWSAAVAGFGMILRNSEFVRGFSHEDVLNLARSAKGSDSEGYRAEFINLVSAQDLLVRK